MTQFHDRLKKITENNNRKLATRKQGQVWPIEKRIEVVGQWLIYGNLKMAAAATGVDYDLVRKWATQPWWNEAVAEIRATKNIEMDNRLSSIVEKTLEATMDRVVNGDYIYDQKTGEIRRKPAALRDIHRVAVDLLGKREFLRDKTEQRKEGHQVSVEEHLKILANQMAEWFEGKKKPVVIDVEDVEIKDAIPEEREAGLQTGTPVGEENTSSTGEATRGTEQSSEDGRESGQSPQG
jgi:hypothetical protein